MDDDAPRHRRTRLTPEAREQAIVRAAIGFFADNGFEGQTRELARSIGVSQALIFRYFPTKEDLIDRVYEEVFGKSWRTDLTLLTASGPSLEERLTAFYQHYARLILGHDYTRLLLFAALNKVDYHGRLFSKIAGEIYPVVIGELRTAHGKPPITERPVSRDEIEAVWGLHASIFFLGIRGHVFRLDVPPVDETVALKVRMFLAGVSVELYG